MKTLLDLQNWTCEATIDLARVGQSATLVCLDRTLRWGGTRGPGLPRTTARLLRHGVTRIADPSEVAANALSAIERLSGLNREFVERVIEAIDEDPHENRAASRDDRARPANDDRLADLVAMDAYRR